MKELLFKEEVLKKEKQLLVQFANHVSKIHSVKVLMIYEIMRIGLRTQSHSIQYHSRFN